MIFQFSLRLPVLINAEVRYFNGTQFVTETFTVVPIGGSASLTINVQGGSESNISMVRMRTQSLSLAQHIIIDTGSVDFLPGEDSTLPANLTDDFFNKTKEVIDYVGNKAEELGEDIGEIFGNIDDILASTIEDACDISQDLADVIRSFCEDLIENIYEEIRSSPNSSFLSPLIEEIKAWWTRTPLILDMDGDGIELSNVADADAVYFNFDGNGFSEATEFAKGGDGLLSIDLNADGIPRLCAHAANDNNLQLYSLKTAV